MAEIVQFNRARLLLCDCGASQAPDAEAIRKGTGLHCDTVRTALCRGEIGDAVAALEAGGPLVIACAQEARSFHETAEEHGAADRLTCIDIRDRAGWGEGDPGPKMAALVADARLPHPPVPATEIESEGVCLVYGAGAIVLPAAARLSAALTVTAMVTDREAEMPPEGDYGVVAGRIVTLEGSIGHFSVAADGFAELEPAGRGPRRFGPARDGAGSECDIVLDLSGGTPLVPAPEKRDGYLRADPGDPLAVERALFDAAQLVGQFEKPLHVRLTESLCAHSRAQQTGCTRCLDICPTGAIVPDGDHVSVDPGVCAGCGACSAVCPSGAIATEEPPTAHLFQRMRVMAEAWRAAEGPARVGPPRLAVHDAHGGEAIRLGARFGRGLPADVIPMEIEALASFGHAEMLGALALGYAQVTVLAAPRTDRETVGAQMALARAVLDGAREEAADTPPRIALVDESDPDAMLEALHAPAPPDHGAEPILALGGRRETVRLAARALAGAVPAAPLPLPDGAPYGAVAVNQDACTLCLSCAGLCPTGALGDNPDRPELTFREEACIQCGLCAGLCPEKAITLVPRLDLSDAALAPRVLKEEEPFECVECGRPFGVKSTVERIAAKLESHSMFAGGDRARMIRMCDDCRVRAQFHDDRAPFRFGEVPKVRTTEDYLRRDTGDE